MAQYIKLGDDQSPIKLESIDNNCTFKATGSATWAKTEEEITPDFLRSRIEPWLTALFQSEHLNLLIGAGLSSAIQEAATGEKPQGMGWIEDLKVCK